MKSLKITFLFAVLAILLSINVVAQKSSAFIHEALANTIISSKTILDTTALNGNSNMILMQTHNYNPGGGAGVFVDKVVGFRFQSLKWYIINQDNSAFIENSQFNVFVPGTDAYSWVFSTTASNTTGNRAVIDDGRINNNPNAKIFINNVLANYNNKVTGIYYNTAVDKWYIFNQAGPGEAMDENLDFNIIVPKGNTGYNHFVHTADGNNTSNHFTYINDPYANSNPDAIIFVTQVWNPGGTANGVYNNHNVGVQYKNNNKWVIYNEDLANMPMGASFNVMVFKNNSIGIEEQEITSEDVKIFPNPAVAGNSFFLQIDELLTGKIDIEIYSISGEMVHAETVDRTAGNAQVEISPSLTSGMYVLKIVNNGKAGAQRLIIQ